MIEYIIITPFFPSAHSFRGSYLLDQAKAIQSNSNYKSKLKVSVKIEFLLFNDAGSRLPL